MTLYRVELRNRVGDILRAADTLAGPNVFCGRTQPVSEEALPALYLWCADDRGESAGPNALSFTRTASVAVKGLVAAGSEENAVAIVDALAEQIELTVLSNVGLIEMVSDIPSIQAQTAVSSSNGTHLAEVRYLFDFRYVETFNPNGVPLKEINGRIATESNADFADMRVTFNSEGNAPCV
ncbi:hypothetical protein AA103196_2274 [Ameyamaea chiangmaiensis NBRC 103196]|uniref:Uncharacterized protein n=1 Tax=Ameyamaea chiangmaiensis TaxID=442969 RepID=A0A850PDA2_9PROT|nr:hypothetical protein [Ameyamaea chiangmaiensis]MBS4075467.1 hypothetical protein [Ameyamaea chiangmaiensis]NVN39001.1 hypothetical protein [Ameyamaea chiangmaiensis]GBQ69663.1 hypothetical protein AA103196_2274 [Ameyamaea chiangmaiensis NBRC 103196]